MEFKEYLQNPPLPSFLQFETSTSCQAACVMCPHDKMERVGTAKWSLINKLIHESAGKVSSICPFLYQEPFLEPRLVAILTNIKQNNPQCQTVLYSNFNSVKTADIKTIIDYNLLDELHISFYGPTEELYKKYQPPLDRAQTVANIQAFYNYRQKQGKTKPKITLHVLNVPDILAEINGYKDVIKYVDESAVVQFDTFHGDIPDMAGDQSKTFGAPYPRVPCQRLWNGLNVHFDGSVVPCCLDYKNEHVMGNASTQTLEEIWSSPKFQAFRELHLAGQWDKIPMCRDCKVHEYQFSPEWTQYFTQQKLCYETDGVTKKEW